MKVLRASLVISALLVGIVAQPASAAHWSSATWVSGNPSCVGGLKIEPVADGTYAASFGGFAGSITIDVSSSALGPVFSFDTDIDAHVVTSVMVKGGPNALLYTYSPGTPNDSGLHSPVNPNNDKYYGLSHLCFFTAKK